MVPTSEFVFRVHCVMHAMTVHFDVDKPPRNRHSTINTELGLNYEILTRAP